MTIWAAIYLTMLFAAVGFGRPPRMLIAVMAANFALGMIVRDSVTSVAVVDLACAALLLGISSRAYVVAGLFALMVPFYVAGNYFQWQNSTTYTIIDLIAYTQCGVIGRVDGGISGLYRRINSSHRNWGSAPNYLGGRAKAGRGSQNLGLASKQNSGELI